MKKYWKDVKRK